MPMNFKHATEAMLQWGRTHGADYARQPAQKLFAAGAAKEAPLAHGVTWAQREGAGDGRPLVPGAHPLAASLREVLKAREGNRVDCADIRLTEARCSGWLMTPDAHANMQRRWAVLTYPPGAALASIAKTGTPLSPRTPGTCGARVLCWPSRSTVLLA
eukprot:m.925492 g.925492  ORF g.925492 m.925492 type:complete len:158 (+) comp23774_c0_seq14:812-1285(+)